ncbi:MAG: TetR/AcrR family transcriptional regulator [Sodaliphilus sp.]
MLQESKQMLFSIGVSSMTMDMVARSCGISKRTLYEQFPDKKSLVKECLTADCSEVGESLKLIFERSSNCFSALFGTFYYMRKKWSMIHINFVAELRRMYPDLYEKFYTEDDHKRVDEFASVLSEAQNQGLVVGSINTKVAAFLFFVTIRSLNGSNQNTEFGFDQLSEYGLNQVEVLDGAFVNFLRGVATPKGLELIDAYLQKNNQQ